MQKSGPVSAQRDDGGGGEWELRAKHEHVGVALCGPAHVSLADPFDRRGCGLVGDEEREEVSVGAADDRAPVLEAVVAVGELLDVPLHNGWRAGDISKPVLVAREAVRPCEGRCSPRTRCRGGA